MGVGWQVTGSPLRIALGLASDAFAASLTPWWGGGPGPSGRTKAGQAQAQSPGPGPWGAGCRRPRRRGLEAGAGTRGFPGAASDPRQVRAGSLSEPGSAWRAPLALATAPWAWWRPGPRGQGQGRALC